MSDPPGDGEDDGDDATWGADTDTDPDDEAGWDLGTESDDDAEWGSDDDAGAASGSDTEWEVGVDEVGPDADGGGPDLWNHVKLVGGGLLVVVFAFVLGIGVLLLMGLGISAAGIELTDTDLLFVSLIGLQGIAFPVTAYGYLRYTGRSVREFIPVRWPSILEALLVLGATIGAFVLAYATILVVVFGLGLEAASNSAGETVQENPEIVPYLLPFVLVLNGPGEELLFRGVLQGRFRESYSAPVAIVLATLMFAPAHIVALTGSLQQALVTIAILSVPSLVFGAVYEYTGNFVVPALVHGLYNSILFGLVYVASVYDLQGSEFIALASLA